MVLSVLLGLRNLPARILGDRLRYIKQILLWFFMVDDLSEHHTDGEIAQILNKKRKVSGTGQPFDNVLKNPMKTPSMSGSI